MAELVTGTPRATAPEHAAMLKLLRSLASGQQADEDGDHDGDSSSDGSSDEIFRRSAEALRLEQLAPLGLEIPAGDANPSDYPLLREALLGEASEVLWDPVSLPRESTFEPLIEAATNVSVQAGDIFDTHTSYALPSATEGNMADTIHRFMLSRELSTPLNSKLTVWALERERLSKLSSAEPGPGSDSGVRKTNQGGFQTYSDIFSRQADNARHRAFRPCRTLHAVVSAAMDEIGEAAYPHHDEQIRPPPGEPHAAYAWGNVNRGTDHNIMHVHNRQRCASNL